MRSMILSLAFILPGLANAEVFSCTFTEPFVTASYDTASQTLTWQDSTDAATGGTIADLSFEVLGAGDFAVVDSHGGVVLSLKLTNEGSDGMSNTKYAYDGRWLTKGFVGGCVSSRLGTIE